MSVVNKMLQDLESRQDQQEIPNADYVPPARSRSGVWLAIVLVILLLAAGGYWWYSENQPPAALQKTTIQKTAIHVPLPSPSTNRVQSVAQTAIEEKTESFESESQLQQVQTLVQQQPDPKQEVQQQGDVNTTTSSFEFTAAKPPNTELALKQQIQVALQQKDDGEAIKLLKKLLKMKPDNQLARKKLASLLFAQGMTNESKQVIETGIRLQPDYSEFRMMLARFYVQQKNTDEAHNTLRELNVSASVEPNLVSYRASLAKKLERFNLAKLDYMNLLASQPSNAKWWLGLAISEEKLGNKRSALKAYRKVSELNQLSLEVTSFVQKRIQYLVGVL